MMQLTLPVDIIWQLTLSVDIMWQLTLPVDIIWQLTLPVDTKWQLTLPVVILSQLTLPVDTMWQLTLSTFYIFYLCNFTLHNFLLTVLAKSTVYFLPFVRYIVFCLRFYLYLDIVIVKIITNLSLISVWCFSIYFVDLFCRFCRKLFLHFPQMF